MRPDQLGEQLRAQLQEGPDHDRPRLARQQQRLIDAVAARRTSPWHRPMFAAAGAVVLLIVSAGILLWVSGDPALECHTDSGQVLAEGDWVEAPEGPVGLAFTEGSQARLEPKTRVRLSRNDASETRLTLESGKLQAHVNRGGRTWTFQAGPYRVRVTGTRLTVSWDSRQQQFEVSVSEGAVQVFGEGIAQTGLAVRRGERLQADRRQGEIRHLRRMRPSPAPDARSDAPGQLAVSQDSAPGPSVDSALVTRSPVVEPPRSRRRRRGQREEGRHRKSDGQWQRLARKGDFGKTLKMVQEIGFQRVLGRASAWDLLLLADAARLGHKPRWASQTLLTLRRRFPGTKQAQLAAFRLGRLAFDTRRDYGEAARWLRRFIAAAPGHPLSGHARGRLMLALLRSGDRSAARKTAEIYLSKHPGGSYAAAARGILEARKH